MPIRNKAAIRGMKRRADIPVRLFGKGGLESPPSVGGNTITRIAGKTKTGGFTLAEVLAALLFMAIVVPVAIAALQVASLSGEVAERKASAARIGDRVLSEAAVTASSSSLPPNGTAVENGRSFRWTLQHETWPVSLTSTSSMQVLTVRVAFLAQGRDYDVRLSTLVNGP